MAQPTSPQLPKWIAFIIIAAVLMVAGFLLIKDIQPPSRPEVQTSALNPASTTATTATTFTGTPPKTFVDPSPANFDKKVFNVALPDAFRKTSDNSWSVKGGRLFMQVHRDKNNKLVVRYVYPYEDFLPKDTVAMLRTRWIMTETHKLMSELQITQEQWEQLNAVKAWTDTQVSAADKKTALAFFEQALAAFNQNETVNGGQPSAAEEKLTDFVRDLDQKYYDTTIANANKVAGEVKAIFTDLQFTGLMRRYSTW